MLYSVNPNYPRVFVNKLLNKVNVKRLVPITVIFILVQLVLMNSFYSMGSTEHKSVSVKAISDQMSFKYHNTNAFNQRLLPNVLNENKNSVSKKRRKPLGLTLNKDKIRHVTFSNRKSNISQVLTSLGMF